MVVAQLTSRKILGVNQRAYQCLKLSLSLNSRRQLLLAVCDNIVLQKQLADQLEHDMAQGTRDPDAADTPALENWQSLAQHNPLMRLTLATENPNLVTQVAQWLKQHGHFPEGTLPSLQILGIEQMTCQPLMVQHRFLESLDSIETLLPHLNTNLLIWLPWPWFRALQQSATRFWQWRSGVFEFVGEPTPIISLSAEVSAEPVMRKAATLDTSTGYRQQDTSQGYLYGDLPRSTFDYLNQPWQPPTDKQPIDKPAADKPPRTEPSSEVENTAPEPVQPSDQPLAPAPDQASRTTPQEQAQAYLTLGHFYRDRIEAGETTPDVIGAAIEAYESALQWLPENDEAWGTGLNDLGTLYWISAQQSSDRQTLLAGMQRSLETYQTGLAKVDQKQAPDIASRLYSNLGAVYSTLATYDNAAENLRQAVQAYRQALPFTSADDFPEEYATLQNSLGSIYWKLSHYDQAKSCLHRAIAAYNEALRARHPEKAPLDYATVQNNLGIAYWSLSKHERPIFLLKHAIAAYRDALNYRTPTAEPSACASTYNNLGTAYWELAKQVEPSQDPQNRYLQNAAIAYEAALKAAQRVSKVQGLGLDLKSIHHCLGNVYDQLAKVTTSTSDMAAPLRKALFHYLAALGQADQTSDLYISLFSAVVRCIRTHYEKLGLVGQQQALSQLPPSLLSEVIQSL
jgi:tetratricopeptide (TPR) repeat protein